MPPDLLQFIHRKLNRLERLLRFYAVLDGTAFLFFAVALLFWGDLAFDRFFELPQLPRYFIGIGLLGVIVFVFWQRVVQQYFLKPKTEALAAVFERFVPQLNGSLVTVTNHQHDAEPVLLQSAIYNAATVLRSSDVRRFFRTRRLYLVLFTALAGLATVPAFCWTDPETASVWFHRNILFSPYEYPRRSLLLADGFQDGRVKIGRGDSFTLSVRAATAMPRVPDALKIKIGSETTGFRMFRLNEFTLQRVNGSEYRVFTQTFPEMLDSQILQIKGADSTLDGLQIEVVPPPMLTGIKLKLTYPDYIQRPPQTVPVIGRTMIPDGTSAEVIADATKPLTDLKVEGMNNTEQPPVASYPLSSVLYPLSTLRQDIFLTFHLTDIDGIHNRQPIQVALGITKDLPPKVAANLNGIGTAVTPNVVLPVSGEITDDYGIAGAGWQQETAAGKKFIPFEDSGIALKSTPSYYPLKKMFDVSELKMNAGEKLTLYVSATDKFNLEESAGQTGESNRWTLEIVTPERLKTLLEVQETTLRQRYEVIIGETERTKAMLPDLPNQPDYAKSRILRDTHKEVYDQQAVADAFEGIRQEMFNNRILNEDEKMRLESSILKPLRNIITVDFPELDKRIQAASGAETLPAVAEQFDLTIKNMQSVRDSMISLESFNEAVELLRGIIKQQLQIRNETLQEKNSRLKNLLQE